MVLPKRTSVRAVSENSDTVDTSQAVGNYLRTDQALAHATANEIRFSNKYRRGIVERLLEGKSTVSNTCQELSVSELEIQRWIKEYLQFQLGKVSQVADRRLITNEPAGSEMSEPVDWSTENMAGLVIESSSAQKPR